MDSDYNRDNAFRNDFIRSSANDFWKLDNIELRDSDRRFQEMFYDNNQFFSMNRALEETFSNSYAKNDQYRPDVEFEEREEPTPETDTNTTLSRITALFIENQFTLTLQYIEKHYPLLLINHPIIKITILKLIMFRQIINHEIEEGFKTLDKLLVSFNLINMFTQRRFENCQILMQYPDVIKSRFYNNCKQQEYLNRLLKLINYGLLENGSIFVGFTEDPSSKYESIQEDYLYLKDFEEELVCLLAKFYKVRDVVEDFDEFSYNVKEFCFNPRDKNAIFCEINEFMNSIKKEFPTKTASPMMYQEETLAIVDSQNDTGISIFSIHKINQKQKDSKFKSSTNNIAILPEMIYRPYPVADSSTSLEIPGKICSDSTLMMPKDKNKNIKLNKLRPYVFKKFKRENIDKKTLRKYRRYLLIRIKQIDSKSLTKVMIDFLNNSLFPPFTVEDISFKSFNTSYLIWIFSHADLAEFYEEYIELNLERMVIFLAETFKVKDESEIETLSNYLKNMAKIYSNFHGNDTSHSELNYENAQHEKKNLEGEKMNLEQQFMRLSVENFIHNDDGNMLKATGNLRMSKTQKDELISRMFDEYKVDLDD